MQAQAVFIPTCISPATHNEPGKKKEVATSGAAAIMQALAITTTDVGDQLYHSAGGDGLFSLQLAVPQRMSRLQTAQLTYTGADPLPTLTYILVKAGKVWTIWDASDWDGSEIQIDNQDLLSCNKNGQRHRNGLRLPRISQLTVFGFPNAARVPDGGLTAALLGMALLGVGSLKKVLCR
jgi:hypothetical protein